MNESVYIITCSTAKPFSSPASEGVCCFPRLAIRSRAVPHWLCDEPPGPPVHPEGDPKGALEKLCRFATKIITLQPLHPPRNNSNAVHTPGAGKTYEQPCPPTYEPRSYPAPQLFRWFESGTANQIKRYLSHQSSAQEPHQESDNKIALDSLRTLLLQTSADTHE